MEGTFVSVHHIGKGQPDVHGIVPEGGSKPWFVPQPTLQLGVSLDPSFLLKCVPCPFHFSKNADCRYGDKCFYSHDRAVYMASNQLRVCPNTNCTNLCRGRQCRECHNRMRKDDA